MKTEASPLGTHCSAKTRQPVPAADDDDAEQRGVPKFAPGGKMRLRKIGDRQQDDSGDGVAQAISTGGAMDSSGDADAQVRGAPEETDRGQRQVGLKMRMARQNSG